MMTDLLLTTTPATLAAQNTSSGLSWAMTEGGLNPLEVLFSGINRLDILNHPEELLDTLQQLHIVWAGIFICVGLLSVLNGYRWYRWIVMIVAFLAGMGLGKLFMGSMEVNLIVVACVGALAAVVAWPMMKYAVTACGGLAGAFIGANVWTAADLPAETHYAGALIGLIAAGMLSFILYRVVIVMMTCVTGALAVAIGVITILMHIESLAAVLRQDFVANPLIIPMVVLVTAVFGFVIQQAGTAWRNDQKANSSKAAAGGKPAAA